MRSILSVLAVWVFTLTAFGGGETPTIPFGLTAVRNYVLQATNLEYNIGLVTTNGGPARDIQGVTVEEKVRDIPNIYQVYLPDGEYNQVVNFYHSGQIGHTVFSTELTVTVKDGEYVDKAGTTQKVLSAFDDKMAYGWLIFKWPTTVRWVQWRHWILLRNGEVVPQIWTSRTGSACAGDDDRLGQDLLILPVFDLIPQEGEFLTELVIYGDEEMTEAKATVIRSAAPEPRMVIWPSTSAPTADVALAATPRPSMDLVLGGKPGTTVKVERSDALGVWSPLATVTLDEGGVAKLTVPVSGNSGFFRLTR